MISPKRRVKLLVKLSAVVPGMRGGRSSLLDRLFATPLGAQKRLERQGWRPKGSSTKPRKKNTAWTNTPPSTWDWGAELPDPSKWSWKGFKRGAAKELWGRPDSILHMLESAPVVGPIMGMGAGRLFGHGVRSAARKAPGASWVQKSLHVPKVDPRSLNAAHKIQQARRGRNLKRAGGAAGGLFGGYEVASYGSAFADKAKDFTWKEGFYPSKKSKTLKMSLIKTPKTPSAGGLNASKAIGQQRLQPPSPNVQGIKKIDSNFGGGTPTNLPMPTPRTDRVRKHSWGGQPRTKRRW